MYSQTLRQLGARRDMDPHARCQIVLFATWLEINDTTPEDANLDSYKAWLESWGIPPGGAALHLDAIRRRLAELTA